MSRSKKPRKLLQAQIVGQYRSVMPSTRPPKHGSDTATAAQMEDILLDTAWRLARIEAGLEWKRMRKEVPPMPSLAHCAGCGETVHTSDIDAIMVQGSIEHWCCACVACAPEDAVVTPKAEAAGEQRLGSRHDADAGVDSGTQI